MPRRFRSINGGAAPAAAAGPSQARRTQNSRRRRPRNPDRERVQKFVKTLTEKFASNGGNIDMPPGITNQNTVIDNIIRNGVPQALSHAKHGWTHDEYEFVRCAQDWQHAIVAAYLGRTEMACRLKRNHLSEVRRGPTQQDTEVTQNDPLQHPPSGSSDSVRAPASPGPSPGDSYGASGRRRSSATFDQLWQTPFTAMWTWRDFSPAPAEPATRTTLDMQAAAIKDSAPASHAIVGFRGLNILADAAAAVEQNRAVSRPPYQYAVSVMGHDVGDCEVEEQEAEAPEDEEHGVD
ncbi:hypothetical protein QM012_009530 [Aureobasidium pullulans]|uniref:Myb-like domain-containing protein n=1 Tax=Aureobasidium pullulans TaxID=5580 RepID=A0ABR0THN1_AURPU